MKKPDILTLPTSQMEAYCDVLGLGKEVQFSIEDMVIALEEADFSTIKYAKPEPGKPREPNSVGFKPESVTDDIIELRKASLGR